MLLLHGIVRQPVQRHLSGGTPRMTFRQEEVAGLLLCLHGRYVTRHRLLSHEERKGS